MAQYTVAQVENKVQRRFPDFTDALADEYMNQVHQDVLFQLPLITATEDISVTSGTQEYAYSESAIRLVAAEWVTSATDRKPLEAVEMDYLNQEERGWRKLGSGTPSRYYHWRSATAYVVGLLPKPNQTTATYPVLRLHQTRIETITSGDSLPKGLLTYDAYVYGALYRFALDNRANGEEVAMFKQLYEEAIAKERKVLEFRHPAKKRIAMHGLSFGGVS